MKESSPVVGSFFQEGKGSKLVFQPRKLFTSFPFSSLTIPEISFLFQKAVLIKKKALLSKSILVSKVEMMCKCCNLHLAYLVDE